MEENSLHYWIIPIICMISIIPIFAFSVDYKHIKVFPNAELERQEMENMSCPENSGQKMLRIVIGIQKTPRSEKLMPSHVIHPKETQRSGLSPYVEFCTPGGFAPVKKIENSTHLFNHDTCIWNFK